MVAEHSAQLFAGLMVPSLFACFSAGGDLSECGNAMVENEEACDDGVNDNSYNGCRHDCLALGPYCGDGKVNGDEACDDGVNDNSYGGCDTDCYERALHCGDGWVDGPEVCDDGNNVSGDGCTSDCSREEYCGNGYLESDEICDDGVNDGSYDSCEPDCMAHGPHCGDNWVEGPEICDDGNNISGDGCSADCSFRETDPDGEYDDCSFFDSCEPACTRSVELALRDRAELFELACPDPALILRECIDACCLGTDQQYRHCGACRAHMYGVLYECEDRDYCDCYAAPKAIDGGCDEACSSETT